MTYKKSFEQIEIDQNCEKKNSEGHLLQHFYLSLKWKFKKYTLYIYVNCIHDENFVEIGVCRNKQQASKDE